MGGYWERLVRSACLSARPLTLVDEKRDRKETPTVEPILAAIWQRVYGPPGYQRQGPRLAAANILLCIFAIISVFDSLRC
ncbi:hypothetical protein T08_8065, partial [Trichinella sp. T8]